MNDELKPCPFCGGSVSFAPYMKNGLKIECKPCVISYRQRTLRYGLDWLEKKMAEHWNRRAPLSASKSAFAPNEYADFEAWIAPRNFHSLSRDAARLGWMARAKLAASPAAPAQSEEES